MMREDDDAQSTVRRSRRVDVSDAEAADGRSSVTLSSASDQSTSLPNLHQLPEASALLAEACLSASALHDAKQQEQRQKSFLTEITRSISSCNSAGTVFYRNKCASKEKCAEVLEAIKLRNLPLMRRLMEGTNACDFRWVFARFFLSLFCCWAFGSNGGACARAVDGRITAMTAMSWFWTVIRLDYRKKHSKMIKKLNCRANWSRSKWPEVQRSKAVEGWAKQAVANVLAQISLWNLTTLKSLGGWS